MHESTSKGQALNFSLTELLTKVKVLLILIDIHQNNNTFIYGALNTQVYLHYEL
jgi:hypothetical protein